VGQVHNEFRAGNIGRGIVEALGAASYDVGIERIGETLTPVIDIWSQPEWAIGRQEFLGWATVDLAAGGAGKRSVVGARNISTIDDPWVVVIEPGTNADCSSNVGIFAAISFTDVADSAQFVVRDGRSRIAPPMVRLRADNTLAVPAGITAGEAAQSALLPTGSFDHFKLEQPVILRFGQGFYLFPKADNGNITATFYARSRRLFPGERTGAA